MDAIFLVLMVSFAGRATIGLARMVFAIPFLDLPTKKDTRLLACVAAALFVGWLPGIAILERPLEQKVGAAYAQSALPVADGSTPSISSMPDDQTGFLSVIIGYQPDAGKEPREDSRVNSYWHERVQAICNAIPTQSVVGWHGAVSSIGTDSSGKISLQVALWDNVWLGTWRTAAADAFGNTLIEPGSPVAGDVSQLKVGDIVSFSGNFIRRSDDDCAFEKSLTQSDSLDAPEFVFKFRSVKAEPSLDRAPSSRQSSQTAQDSKTLAERRAKDEEEFGLRKTDPDEYLRRLKSRDTALWLAELQFIRPDQYAAFREEEQKNKAAELADKQRYEPEKFLGIDMTSSRVLGRSLLIDFVVESTLPFAVKDIAVLCRGFDDSGSSIKSHEEKLHETIPANGRTSIKDVDMGEMPAQVASVHCIAVHARSVD